MKFAHVLSAAILGVCSLPLHSFAAVTYTWDSDAAGDNNWATPGNWTPSGGPPVAGDTAQLINKATIAKQPNIYAAVNAELITIDNTGADWNLVFNTGAALGLSANGTGGVTLTGGGTSLLGPITTLSNTATFDIGTGGTLQFERNISGSGAIIKNGAGTVIFNLSASAGRSASATTTINNGTVKITGSGSALGASGAPVTVNSGATFELGGVGLTANVTLKNGSTLKSSAAGNSILNAGELVALDAGALVTIDTGTSGNTLQLGTNTNSFGGGDASTLITVQGTGKLQLTGGNTSYAGGWKITNGVVQVDNNNAFGSAGSAKLELAGGRTVFNGGSNNATLTVSIPIKVTSNSAVAIDRLSTSGTITSRTIGTVDVGNATMTVDVGGFVSGGGGTGSTATLISGPLTLSGAAKFNIPQYAIGGQFSTACNVVYAPGAITGGANGFEKLGAGQMTIASASSYGGATTVSGGSLVVTNTGGLGTTSSITVASGATLSLVAGTTNNWTSKADLSGNGLISLTGGTSGNNTFNAQGSAISPGASAGILSITGNLVLALDPGDSSRSALNIEVTGGNGAGNAAAGIDYDQLAVSGTVTGLANTTAASNADLNVNISGVTQADMNGDTLTILTSSSNFAGLVFHQVNVTGGTADVNYLNGSITLSNIQVSAVPEPASLAVLGLGGLLLASRGTRKRRV